MKKSWLAGALLGALTLGIVAGATAATSVRKNIEVDYSGIKIKVDGKLVDSGPSEPFLVVAEGRTYIPARFLAEAMGGKVGWDGATRTVLVHTPTYVQASTSGSLTTYSVPYFGTSLTLPATGNQVSGTSNLLQVEFGSDTAVVVNRIPLNGSGFDQLLAGTVAGVTSSMQLTVSEEIAATVSGAVQAKDIKGTANVGGQPFNVWIRGVASSENLWVITAISKPAVASSTVSGYVEGFQLGK